MATAGQRVFLARSDPALNAGLVPAVLAVKAALSAADVLGDELGLAVYPIVGTGSLPFRGGVNPKYTDEFLSQYAGVRTYSIQSAFRYDYARDEVNRALNLIRREAPRRAVQRVSEEDRLRMQQAADIFAAFWRPTIEALASRINRIAQYIPARRERLQHIGLFGYSRGVGTVRLPRAITFTAALYSIGVPPELIATGRGLRVARAEGLLDTLEEFYPTLRADLDHAGKYLNRENLDLAAGDDEAFCDIRQDIEVIDDYLGRPLGPRVPRHIIHRNLTSSVYQRLREEPVDDDAVRRDIVAAARIRRSLG